MTILISKETVARIANESGMKKSFDCCAQPLKFCSTDQWTGELAAFAQAIAREALSQYVESCVRSNGPVSMGFHGDIPVRNGYVYSTPLKQE